MTTAAIDGAGLLQAILAEPGDDSLRLIYADWLDDEGQHERAEFIRVQVELARLEGRTRVDPGCWCAELYVGEPCCDVCQGWEDRLAWLKHRERELLLATKPGQWSGVDMSPHGFYDWHRGFVVSVKCPLDAWRRHGPALVAAHPLERVEPGRIDVSAEVDADAFFRLTLQYRPSLDWVVEGTWRAWGVEDDAQLESVESRGLASHASGGLRQAVVDAFRGVKMRMPASEGARLLKAAISDALLAWARAEATKA
jgi:uncharacterized protein (TIGR02996 family)